LESQIGVRYQSKRTVTVMTGDASFHPKPATDEGVTGTASVAYQLTDDVRVYATYGRSYRSGGFTVAPSTPGDLTEYEPEISDSIELGFKSRLADGRVQINGDIYYQKYHDFLARTSQGIRTLGGPSGIGTDFLNYNADALSQGAELQIDVLLTDDWLAGLGISYNDAKFTGGKAYCNVYDSNNVVQNPTSGEVNKCDANGRLSGEPNWGVSANSEYTMHFGAVDSFVRTQYTFSSGRSDDSQPNSVLDTSSYGVWNLFAGIRDPKKTWEVSVWAKNLFDHQQVITRGTESTQAGVGLANAPDGYITGGAVLDGAPDIIGTVPDTLNPAIRSGYNTVQLIPERQFGITGKYNFSL